MPPEDVGGTLGFEQFIEIMKDKSHPERESYITWYGFDFDTNQVDLDQINEELMNLHPYIHEIENPQDQLSYLIINDLPISKIVNQTVNQTQKAPAESESTGACSVKTWYQLESNSFNKY